MESYSEIKTIKQADKILRALARQISKLKGNAKGEISVFQRDENQYERMTRGDYAKELRRDKSEVQERKTQLVKDERDSKSGKDSFKRKVSPITGERLKSERGANRDRNIDKDRGNKKPRRGGGGRAAGVGSALGRTPKSLLKNKLMPKT